MSNNIIEVTCPLCKFEFETNRDMPCPSCHNPIELPEPDIEKELDDYMNDIGGRK